MNFMTKEKVLRYYERHFGEDYSDFEHIYEIILNIDKQAVDLGKKTLASYGMYFAKTKTKEIRMNYASEELIELTIDQADFIALMGVIITGNAIKALGGL